MANGLPWEAGLEGLTRVPAQMLGVGDRLGTIAPGKLADLVLWTGDPLDVANVATHLWLGGTGDADAFAPDRAARPLPA